MRISLNFFNYTRNSREFQISHVFPESNQSIIIIWIISIPAVYFKYVFMPRRFKLISSSADHLHNIPSFHQFPLFFFLQIAHMYIRQLYRGQFGGQEPEVSISIILIETMASPV